MTSLTTPARRLELYMVVKDPELIRRLMETRTGGPITARWVSREMGWKSHSYFNRILAGEVRSVSTDTGIRLAYLLGVPTDLIFVTRVSSDAGQSVRSA